MVVIAGRSTRKKAPQPSKPKNAKKKAAKKEEIPNHPYALARLDPWNPNAKGAKIPDFDNRHSVGGAVTYTVALTVPASGNGCWLLPFWPKAALLTCTGDATTGWITFGNAPTSIAQYNSMFSGYDEAIGCRLVGGGAKISTPLNANNVSGRVYLSGMSTVEMRAWAGNVANVQKTTEISQRSQVEKLEMGNLVGQPPKQFVTSTLDPTANIYWPSDKSPLDVGEDVGDIPAYVGLLLCVDGAPASTTALEVDIICHYEWVPGKTYQWMATRAEPANMAMMEKVNNMAEAAPSFITGVGNIAQHAIAALRAGVSVAGALGFL